MYVKELYCLLSKLPSNNRSYKWRVIQSRHSIRAPYVKKFIGVRQMASGMYV